MSVDKKDLARLDASTRELQDAVAAMRKALSEAALRLSDGRASSLRTAKDAIIEPYNRLGRAIKSAGVFAGTTNLRNLPRYYGPEHPFSQALTALREHNHLLDDAEALRKKVTYATVGDLDQVRSAVTAALGVAVRSTRSEAHCKADRESVKHALREAQADGAYGVAPGRDPGTPWVALRRGGEEAPVECRMDGTFQLGRWRKSARSHPIVKTLESARSTHGVRYKVAYLDGADRLHQNGDFDLEGAKYLLRAFKRRGRTAWVETLDGTFVPVPGAMRPLPPIGRARQTRSTTLTYGNLPSWKTFEQAFFDHVGDRELYPVSLVGDDQRMLRRCGLLRSKRTYREGMSFDAPDLYAFLECLAKGFATWSARADADAAGSLASSILGTLGFEWV